MNWIKDTYYNIKHVIYWLPVIWNNNWWDSSFLEKIIVHQLQFMHDNWDDACYIGSEKEKNTIGICLRSMKRINEDKYLDMLELVQHSDDTFDYDFYYNGKVCGAQELHFPDLEKQRDLEVFCSCLKDNLFYWWD